MDQSLTELCDCLMFNDVKEEALNTIEVKEEKDWFDYDK